jgi:hypothetical protein
MGKNSKVQENQLLKSDYELLFKDSAEYFGVFNAKMIQEGQFIRFICFNEDNTYKETVWYPIQNIHRIKSY